MLQRLARGSCAWEADATAMEESLGDNLAGERRHTQSREQNAGSLSLDYQRMLREPERPLTLSCCHDL